MLGVLLVRRRVLVEEGADAGSKSKSSNEARVYALASSERPARVWVPLQPPGDEEVESIQRALED